MKRHRSLLLACAAVTGATFASGAPAMAAQPAPAQCTRSFQVLHNDRIGNPPVAAGMYQLRGDGVTCPQATSLFAEFLNDYDGRLGGGWAVLPRSGEFVRGSTFDGFRVKPGYNVKS